MTNFVNPHAQKAASTISLQNADVTRALSQAVINYSTQMKRITGIF